MAYGGIVFVGVLFVITTVFCTVVSVTKAKVLHRDRFERVSVVFFPGKAVISVGTILSLILHVGLRSQWWLVEVRSSAPILVWSVLGDGLLLPLTFFTTTFMLSCDLGDLVIRPEKVSSDRLAEGATSGGESPGGSREMSAGGGIDAAGDSLTNQGGYRRAADASDSDGEHSGANNPDLEHSSEFSSQTPSSTRTTDSTINFTNRRNARRRSSSSDRMQRLSRSWHRNVRTAIAYINGKRPDNRVDYEEAWEYTARWNFVLRTRPLLLVLIVSLAFHIGFAIAEGNLTSRDNAKGDVAACGSSFAKHSDLTSCVTNVLNSKEHSHLKVVRPRIFDAFQFLLSATFTLSWTLYAVNQMSTIRHVRSRQRFRRVLYIMFTLLLLRTMVYGLLLRNEARSGPENALWSFFAEASDMGMLMLMLMRVSTSSSPERLFPDIVSLANRGLMRMRSCCCCKRWGSGSEQNVAPDDYTGAGHHPGWTSHSRVPPTAYSPQPASFSPMEMDPVFPPAADGLPQGRQETFVVDAHPV